MIDGIPIALLNGAGAAGLVLLIGWLIATGKWVPRRTYDDKCHESDEWRAESRLKDQQLHEAMEQNSALLHEIGPTLADFLREMRAKATGMDGDHE